MYIVSIFVYKYFVMVLASTHSVGCQSYLVVYVAILVYLRLLELLCSIKYISLLFFVCYYMLFSFICMYCKYNFYTGVNFSSILFWENMEIRWNEILYIYFL